MPFMYDVDVNRFVPVTVTVQYLYRTVQISIESPNEATALRIQYWIFTGISIKSFVAEPSLIDIFVCTSTLEVFDSQGPCI